jgi:hypothetical protein
MVYDTARLDPPMQYNPGDDPNGRGQSDYRPQQVFQPDHLHHVHSLAWMPGDACRVFEMDNRRPVQVWSVLPDCRDRIFVEGGPSWGQRHNACGFYFCPGRHHGTELTGGDGHCHHGCDHSGSPAFEDPPTNNASLVLHCLHVRRDHDYGRGLSFRAVACRRIEPCLGTGNRDLHTIHGEYFSELMRHCADQLSIASNSLAGELSLVLAVLRRRSGIGGWLQLA